MTFHHITNIKGEKGDQGPKGDRGDLTVNGSFPNPASPVSGHVAAGGSWEDLPNGFHYVSTATDGQALGLPSQEHGLLIKQSHGAVNGAAWFLPRVGDLAWRRVRGGGTWAAWERVE